MKPLIEEYLRIATSQIGVREIGSSNRGKEVDEYLRTVGAGLANPWCAAFTYWAKHKAANNLDALNPFIRSAYTPDIYNWARERDILIPCKNKNGTTNLPQAGDDFLVMGPVRIYHTGIVRDANSMNWRSIEGNSNDEGSREGYEVASNTKPYADRFYWVRWSALVAEAKPLTRTLILGGEAKGELPVQDNVTLAPVRKWAAWMGGQKVDWVKNSDTPIRLNGQPLATEVSMIDGAAFVPLRDLVALDKALALKYDPATEDVIVSRVGAK